MRTPFKQSPKHDLTFLNASIFRQPELANMPAFKELLVAENEATGNLYCLAYLPLDAGTSARTVRLFSLNRWADGQFDVECFELVASQTIASEDTHVIDTVVLCFAGCTLVLEHSDFGWRATLRVEGAMQSQPELRDPGDYAYRFSLSGDDLQMRPVCAPMPLSCVAYLRQLLETFDQQPGLTNAGKHQFATAVVSTIADQCDANRLRKLELHEKGSTLRRLTSTIARHQVTIQQLATEHHDPNGPVVSFVIDCLTRRIRDCINQILEEFEPMAPPLECEVGDD